MFKQLLSVTFITIVLAVGGFAENNIQLQSDVVNGRLIPTIVVNGQTMVRVQDRGNRQLYESNFDRAEKIYSALIDVEQKGGLLSNARVRRYKSEYSIYVDKTHVLTVTKGDTLANNMSGYQLARLWTDTLKASVSPSTVGGEDAASVSDYSYETQFPLAGLATIFTKKGFGLGFFQLLFLLIIQALVAIGVFYYLSKEAHQKEQAVLSQLDKLHNDLSKQRHSISELSQTVKTLGTQKEKSFDVIKNVKEAS
ncbi:hypothetical protein DID77_00900 [Candidatus Marinamargulisbacteria bacterium SCGC AG-439-L15]|nr:hypothetical protein DID77_00900 [Candidatus Marinamargulisbacteria bacterium SCGC AG-439-L15]